MANVNIRELRKRNNLTLAQLAELTGISKGHLSYVENGLKSPTAETLCKIAKVLNCSIADLITCD